MQELPTVDSDNKITLLLACERSETEVHPLILVLEHSFSVFLQTFT